MQQRATSAVRTRLPSRARPRSGLVHEVPASRRAAGAEEDRAGLDGARAAGCGLLHEAARRGLAASACWSRLGVGRCRDCPYRCDVRRCGGRVPALRRAGPRLQAVDAAGLPVELGTRICCRRSATMPFEEITPASIDRWRGSLTGLSNRTKNKLLVVMHGVMRRAAHVWGLTGEPSGMRREATAAVERRHRGVLARGGDGARATAASEQDGAIFLTAAFTGLRRGELLALRWRDVDFAVSTDPRPRQLRGRRADLAEVGQGPVGPMAPDVAKALASLGQRSEWVADDDLVFPGVDGTYLDGSALRRRYAAALRRAGLRPLRFHEYADVVVMPMSLRRGCSERFLRSRGRHNQSASRNARSVSEGR